MRSQPLLFTVVASVSIALFGGSVAHADYVFELRQDDRPELGVGDDGPGSFTIGAGEFTWFDIFLTQADNDTRLSDNGLAIADITFEVRGGLEVSLLEFELGPGFVQDPFVESAITGQSVRLGVVESSGLAGVQPVDQAHAFASSVQIGSVRLGVDPTATGTFELQTGTTPGASFPLNDSTLTALAASPITNLLSITAIPEPGTFGVSLMVVGALCLRRGRRSVRQ
ncbi:MAG: hypothetical protein AAFX06_05040 [Planctomycetota bacterium]